MSVQRRLDFQIRKSTRSSARTKKTEVAEDYISTIDNSPSSSHSRTSRRTTRNATPSKFEIKTDNYKAPITPNTKVKGLKVKKCTTPENIKICMKTLDSKYVEDVEAVKVRTPSRLSETPRKLSVIPSKLSNTPKKLSETPKKLSETPKKLSNTPIKDCPLSNDCENVAEISPRKRLLKFSDVQKSPCSPSKQRKKENCPSPVKSTTERSPKLQLFRQSVSSYTKTRTALHTAQPDRLLCREKEMNEIDTFLSKHLSSEQAGSMYISGAPGTGKTAVLSHLLKIYRNKCLKPVFINCMMMNSSQAIFNAILSQLNEKSTKAKSAKDAQRQLERKVTSKGQMILLVLDEIDQLDSKNQEVLYTMFEWPTLANARLVLIGIANALDLTDRILPRLQTRPKCRPKLINFPPYSKNQIVAILEDRLKESLAEGNCVMEPHALQFCARKVSAVAGDMRKALDVCRRAVEKIEVEVRGQQVLKESVTNSPRKANIPTKVGISHISQVVSEVYGSKVATSSSNQQQTIPLQQKMIVCTLLVMLKNGKTKEIAVGKLHETFLKICKKRNMAVTEQSEFMSMLSLLDTGGILVVKKAKQQRLAKVSMKLDEREVEHALQDKILMTSILSDGIPT